MLPGMGLPMLKSKVTSSTVKSRTMTSCTQNVTGSLKVSPSSVRPRTFTNRIPMPR